MSDAINPPGPSTSRGRGNKRGSSNFRGRGRGNGWRSHWNANRIVAPRERPTTFCIANDNEAENLLHINESSVQQTPVTLQLGEMSGEYPAWKLYHPQEPYEKDSNTVLKVKQFQSHFKKCKDAYDLADISKKLWFILNMPTILGDSQFNSDFPGFKIELQSKPQHTLACAGLAMHQTILNNRLFEGFNSNMRTIKPRVYGYGEICLLRSLKVNRYGRMVSIRGTVIRVGGSYLRCLWMAFQCKACQTKQAIRQPDGIMTPPISCTGVGCRARSNFLPLLSSPYTITEPFQELRLQEMSMGDHYEIGRIPRNIEIQISDELVDSVCPGDDVTITGILKVKPQDDFTRKDQATIYKMYVDGVTILSNSNTLNMRRVEYTPKDIEAIQAIKLEPSPFRLLLHSLCPSIFGHEMVKAGLLLGLFGGTGPGCESHRTETHVLVVGDPGVGKTQMLLACANISPRGIFVCGNSSTAAGLTATVRHEKGAGNSLEAGALVLADQGVCCIDEFDKMTKNQEPLLEVMEQQTVSIAKAGVLCTLPARTCILAAANPSDGHYDKSKSTSENLKIGPALLSRFDLVFILLDCPNEHRDNLLTEHIQLLHTKKMKMNSAASSKQFPLSSYENVDTEDDDVEIPLHERLKLKPSDNLDLLPHILMQKYIGYARKNIHPKLTVEASMEIKKFYLELREAQNRIDSIPVTIRQLEGLVRLTKARARIDLVEVATIEHAQDVLAIFRYCMVDVQSTLSGDYQMKPSVQGGNMSQAAQLKKFLRILEEKSNILQKTIFSTDELNKITTQGGFQIGLNRIIDTLNVQGVLLKKGLNLYKLLKE